MIGSVSGESADQVWLQAASSFRSLNPKPQSSRSGDTRELLHVLFEITSPHQRWVVSREPAINPAFAIVELVWIMLGRNDSAFVNHFNPQLPSFAGDSETYHGAYGYRIRRHFGFDQLSAAAQSLKYAGDSRQVVLQIWDPKVDLPVERGQPRAPDVPCNVMSLLKLRGGRLDWFQVVRSNDIFRGLPYNFAQFLALHEIVAGWAGAEPGHYCQVSDSLHVYEDDLEFVNRDGLGVEPAADTDTLIMAEAESERQFRLLADEIEAMTNGKDASEAGFERRCRAATLQPAFKNFLCVVGAEHSRRMSWSRAQSALISECSNPALRQLWDRWCGRFHGA